MLIISNLQGYFHFCHLADILPQTPDILLPSETNERGNPLKQKQNEGIIIIRINEHSLIGNISSFADIHKRTCLWATWVGLFGIIHWSHST